MKKIVLLLVAFTLSAIAEGFVLGGEVGVGKVKSEVTASLGTASASAETKATVMGLTVKAGYDFGAYRIKGYASSDEYSKDTVVIGEGRAVSYGLEADIKADGGFIGVRVGQGQKDFNEVDIDFTDIALRFGGIVDVYEYGLEIKKRQYDDYQYGAVNIELEDTSIGIFIGFNFNL